MDDFKLIVIHQVLFQGMFFLKNILLSKKLDVSIRGNNIEAYTATLFFVFTILLVLGFSYWGVFLGEVKILNHDLALLVSSVFMILSLVISGASLIGLKDSWRVGIVEAQAGSVRTDQVTDLITTGIYRYSRNPYFVSYLLLFLAYSILLQNLVVILCFFISFSLIHKMILKEEQYLLSVHGDAYRNYQKVTPRYLIV